jgi:hypothetical protein
LLLGTPIMIGARAHRILPPEQHVGEVISISARHLLRLQPNASSWPTSSPFLKPNLMAQPFVNPIFCFITTLGSRSRSVSPAERSDTERIFAMKRMMMILATAALASTLVTAAAEARGGGFGGGGHIGGLGGGAHIGGMMGAGHIGGFDGGARVGGMVGPAHIRGIGEGMHGGGAPMPGGMEHLGGEHLGLGDHVSGNDRGLHQHAMHRFGRYSPGYLYDDGLDCYDWTRLHPGEPLPLSCS